MSPVFEGGFRAGGGVIDSAFSLSTTPWFAVSSATATLALQAPLNVDLDAGELRTQDWDEPGDFGRIIRRLRIGPWVKAGPIRERSMGNGTLMRRYNNGTDPDHGRLGLDLQVDLTDDTVGRYAPNHLELMVDHLLDAPIFGTSVGYRGRHNFLLLSAAGDFGAPSGSFGSINDEFLPEADRGTRWSAGLSGQVRATGAQSPVSIDIHGDLNVMDQSNVGGHLGLLVGYARNPKWSVRVRTEGMVLGPGYTWSLYDQGYLIDRWTGLTNRLAATEFALGGRLSTQVAYRNALIVGGQFASCSQDGRHDLSAYARIPLEKVTLSASWRVRAPETGSGLFSPANAIAAAAAQLKLTRPLSAELLIARDWRVDVHEGRFKPTSTALLSLAEHWAQD